MVKKKEEIPEWVSGEIQNAKFGKAKTLTRTGYILEMYEKDGKVDAQLYEPIEDGRHIVTMDIPKEIKMDDLERGVVYEFKFGQQKAPLSKKVSEWLLKEKQLGMEAIYQFELKSMEPLDVSSAEPVDEE